MGRGHKQGLEGACAGDKGREDEVMKGYFCSGIGLGIKWTEDRPGG